jgi:hypothetical protein
MAQDSVSQQQTTTLWSPSCLLGGLKWDMVFGCYGIGHEVTTWPIPDTSLIASNQAGNTLGLHVHATFPAGSSCRCTASLECVGQVGPYKTTTHFGIVVFPGKFNFFRLGPMPGGFDEGMWAAKGLPASGSITLRLTVKDMGV